MKNFQMPMAMTCYLMTISLNFFNDFRKAISKSAEDEHRSSYVRLT